MSRRKSVFDRLLASLSDSNRPRRSMKAAPTLDSLEGRVVLSHFGHHAHLAHKFAGAAQVGTSASSSASGTSTANTSTPTTTGSTSTSTTGGTSTSTTTGCRRGGDSGVGGDFGGTQDAQLQTDMTQLRTDTQAIISGSTVTDAQRQALAQDLRAINNAGVNVDRARLQAAASTLLTDLANNTYDANASDIQNSFTAAFSGASGAALTSDQTILVNTAYTDFLAVAKGLNVTSAELTSLTNDQTAIQADFTRLGITGHDGATPGDETALNLVLGGPGLGEYGLGGFGGGFGGHHGRH